VVGDCAYVVDLEFRKKRGISWPAEKLLASSRRTVLQGVINHKVPCQVM